MKTVTTVSKPKVISSKTEKPKALRKAIFLPECPVCQARVENLNKHYAKHHLGRRVMDIADLKDARQLIQEGKCPFCDFRKGSKALLLQHLTIIHGVLDVKKSQLRAHASRSSFAEAFTIEDSLPSAEAAEISDHLDSQHLAGQAFREHGQFGSYPLHDAMDDESSA